MLWRLIVEDDPLPGAENMARDQALVESVQAGGPAALRLYFWAPPCLSLGRNQPARGRLDEAAAAAHGLDVVRRPTGGLAVLHDRELTYAAAVAVGVLGSPRETYAALNRGLMAGLRRLGVPAEVAVGRGGGGLEGGACFREAAPGEVTACGRKLVGSAQRREGRVLLQHGSLLLEGEQRLAASLLGDAELEPAAAPVTLAELLGRTPPWDELTAALRAGLEETPGIRFARDQFSAGERARVGRLTEQFRSAAWTWRR